MEYGIWKTQHTVNKTQYDRKAEKSIQLLNIKNIVLYIYISRAEIKLPEVLLNVYR